MDHKDPPYDHKDLTRPLATERIRCSGRKGALEATCQPQELLKKGWKPKATAWRDAAHSPTTFLLPRRGDLDEQHSRKRNFWETEAPPAPPAVVPKLSPAAKIVGAVAKVAPKPTPPWQMAPPPPPPAAPVEPMAAAEEGEWAPEGDGEEAVQST